MGRDISIIVKMGLALEGGVVEGFCGLWVFSRWVLMMEISCLFGLVSGEAEDVPSREAWRGCHGQLGQLQVTRLRHYKGFRQDISGNCIDSRTLPCASV